MGFVVGFFIGIVTPTLLAGACILLMNLWWGFKRLTGIFVTFGAPDLSTQKPNKWSGTMREISLLTKYFGKGYYRHLYKWESRFVFVTVGRFGVLIGRKRELYR